MYYATNNTQKLERKHLIRIKVTWVGVDKKKAATVRKQEGSKIAN